MSEWLPRRDGPWAAVDCGLLRNPKVAELRGRADVLYVACILHCADELTDGHIRPYALRRLLLEARAKRSDVRELERAGLLEPVENDGQPVENGGHVLPGYLDWNPSRSWWESKRETNRRRQAAFRERQQEARQADGTYGSNAERNALRAPLRNTSDETRRRTTKEPAFRGPTPTARAKPAADAKGSSSAPELLAVELARVLEASRPGSEGAGGPDSVSQSRHEGPEEFV